MTILKDELIKRLNFPVKSVVNRILAKDIISRSGDLTPKEKDYLVSDIERVYVLSVLNAQSTNIPAFISKLYRYEEVICLFIQLKSSQRTEQLLKLFHGTFPNPVLLIFHTSKEELLFSTSHKRLNQQDESKVLEDKIHSTAWFDLSEVGYNQFLNFLIFTNLPSNDLYDFYKSMDDNIQLTKTIEQIGAFPDSSCNKKEILLKLSRIDELQFSILSFVKNKKKAIEFNEKMEWHIKIKNIEKQLKIEKEELKELV